VDALLGNDEKSAQQLKEKANKMFKLESSASPAASSISSSSLSPADRLKQSFATTAKAPERAKVSSSSSSKSKAANKPQKSKKSKGK
jgi:hypothetical protein